MSVQPEYEVIKDQMVYWMIVTKAKNKDVNIISAHSQHTEAAELAAMMTRLTKREHYVVEVGVTLAKPDQLAAFVRFDG